MDRKKWMFIFAALGGLGGLACILQWAEIKPKDFGGWHVSLAVPHWLWLVIGLGLLMLSLLVSVSGLYSSVRGDRANTILRTENERLRADYEILNGQFVKMTADFNRAVSTIGQLTAPKSSRLIIHSANYATWSGEGRRYDVTRFLRSIVTGDSLVFGPIENGRFWIEGENLVPNDPKDGAPKRLEVTYSYDGEGQKTIQRAEGGRLTLPEDSGMEWFESELNKAKAELQAAKDNLKLSTQPTQQYPLGGLRLKTLLLCSELQGFLGEQGEEPQRPELHKNPGEDNDDFLVRYRAAAVDDAVMKWRAGFLGAFRMKFKASVPDLRDEILHRARINDQRLNGCIDTAVHDPNGNVQAVKGIIDRLWEISKDMRL